MKRLSKAKKKFFETYDDDSCGLINAPLNAQACINVLAEYILGEDWYSCSGGGVDQVNFEITFEILDKISPAFRQDLKRWNKIAEWSRR